MNLTFCFQNDDYECQSDLSTFIELKQTTFLSKMTVNFEDLFFIIN